MIIEPGPLLAAIDSPDDLKKLAPEQLVQLSTELREFIIDSVSIYGGHFGPHWAWSSSRWRCITFSIRPTTS